MSKHVRMNWKWELGGLSSPGDRFQETCCRRGTAALGEKHISRFCIFPAWLAQGSDFPASQWMNSIDSAFGSVDMEPTAAEINLIPTEAVAVAGPLAGGFLESLDHLGG